LFAKYRPVTTAVTTGLNLFPYSWAVSLFNRSDKRGRAYFLQPVFAETAVLGRFQAEKGQFEADFIENGFGIGRSVGLRPWV
jgi:hypothetical protein